jgi:hypothetical protein
MDLDPDAGDVWRDAIAQISVRDVNIRWNYLTGCWRTPFLLRSSRSRELTRDDEHLNIKRVGT